MCYLPKSQLLESNNVQYIDILYSSVFNILPFSLRVETFRWNFGKLSATENFLVD